MAAGFNALAVEEIVVAVSELATNLARYATDGAITLELVDKDGASALRIESVDSGPGLGDIDQAVSDGFSTGGGLGKGFGSIRRTTDLLDVQSSPAGTRIVAYKWLTRPSS